MATQQFGAPMDEPNPDEQRKPNGQASPSDAPQDTLDPNDPRLVSEDLAANPDADAYAQPAPPPDRLYRVKLKLVPKDDGRGGKADFLPKLWGKPPGQAVLVAGIEASIIDPSGKYDGLKAYDFNVSTFIGRDSATKVTTIVSKLRKPDGKPWTSAGQRMSPRVWMAPDRGTTRPGSTSTSTSGQRR